jgi:hypothetical protein
LFRNGCFLFHGALFRGALYLDVAAHEEAFRAAGFSEIHWYAPRLSPEGEAAFGRDFWATFLDYSPIVFIECVK